MLLISTVSVFHKNALLTLPFLLPRKVIFRSTSALRRWLACMIFSVTIPLHPRTHSSKNYLLISLHGFTLIFSITLFMSTLRMRSQSIQSTLRLLHFILTTQLTFLKYFYIVLIFYATPRFLPQGRRHATYKRAAGRERPTTRKKGPGP